ncbi:hypothetical protein CVIC8964_0229 [Campylobacter vicugnae]|uniref:Uncharacterized protein n=1 Tax=Campylobacter vicugnae TaxID=1660076 RepID=A0A1X9SZR4_9BACT|nr:hypothetical protein [Campylobacter sp. RM8964]ARR01666.1 hypothetical protein CVIC8964_0229 [Campylobacter sp. RM8964]
MLYLMMEKLVDMLEEAKGDLVAELEIYKAMIGYLKIKPAEAQEKSDIEMIKIIQEQIDFQTTMMEIVMEEMVLLN